MTKHESIIFLFTIAREIERSFETPVILFTQKDYGDCIFKSLVDIRATLLNNSKQKDVAEIVNTFHIEWLQAVQEIECFKKRLRDMPRDTIFRAIGYTVQCTQNRYINFQKYIDKFESTMTEDEKTVMQANLDVIKDMRHIFHSALLEKQDYLYSQADQAEYYDKINDEIEELLNWLDKLNDNLAIQCSKVLHLQIPLQPCDLTKTLKQIIDEVADDPDPNLQKIAKAIRSKDDMLSSMIRVNCYNESKIAKVVEKIKILEERISRLNDQESLTLMALRHQSVYLKERLQSFENIKMTLNRLRAISGAYKYQDCWNEDDIHIFNHLLPHHGRCRLVDQLVKMWNNSIGEEEIRGTIISILSTTDLKEVITDVIGQFTVDKYGRKIYTKDGDSQLYQLNENHELVLLQDDDKHVYFFDDCGRYYVNNTRQRIYKAFARASEYVLNRQGLLFKVQEEREGIQYYYDALGRYSINYYGRRVYRTEDSNSEYERDGYGNLIRIKNEPEYKLCSNEPTLEQESTYLKQTVSAALTKCIADVVLHEPKDPIAYLASSLEKYRQTVSARQIFRENENEIIAERRLRKIQTRIPNTSRQSLKGEESVDHLLQDFKMSTDDDVEI